MKPTRHSINSNSEKRAPVREKAPRRDLPAVGEPDVHRERGTGTRPASRKKARLSTPRKVGSEYSGNG